MSFIEARDLVHEFVRRDEEGKICERIRALDGVSLQVKKGEFVGILGHNGSGKSTFARHLNVLLAPTEGTLLVGGMDTSDESHIWEIRQNAGMVFQNPDNQLVAGVVEEDVAFGPENLGIPTEEIKKRVTDSLEAVGMEDYRYRSPNLLSGGQKQRVAIAGVMAMEPQCIIFDESTAMLDPSGRADVLEAARELNRDKGVTIIWITHYMEEVVEADRIYVMDAGKVKTCGTPREIFSQVKMLEDIGLDVPRITRLAWELREDGLDIPAGILNRHELKEALERIRKRRENGTDA